MRNFSELVEEFLESMSGSLPYGTVHYGIMHVANNLWRVYLVCIKDRGGEVTLIVNALSRQILRKCDRYQLDELISTGELANITATEGYVPICNCEDINGIRSFYLIPNPCVVDYSHSVAAAINVPPDRSKDIYLVIARSGHLRGDDFHKKCSSLTDVLEGMLPFGWPVLR
jgi:hypothetical protein